MTYNYDILQQKKVVKDAMDAMELEINAIWWPRYTVEKFLNYVYTIGLNHRAYRMGNKKRKQVIQIKDGNIINCYPSITDAAKALHCRNTSIYLVLSGKNSTAKGYFWEYL